MFSWRRTKLYDINYTNVTFKHSLNSLGFSLIEDQEIEITKANFLRNNLNKND